MSQFSDTREYNYPCVLEVPSVTTYKEDVFLVPSAKMKLDAVETHSLEGPVGLTPKAFAAACQPEVEGVRRRLGAGQ